MKKEVVKIILVAVIVISASVGFQMNELVKLGDGQERFEYEHVTYLERASREASIVNSSYGSESRIQPLSKEEYWQVADAITVIEKYDLKTGIHLNKMLGQGYILDDSGLQDSVLAETRRDGSSKPLLTPAFMAEKICLDGNIYLNFTGSDYSFTSDLYIKMKRLISKLEEEEGLEESRLLKYRQELNAYERKAAFSLESTLAHEERHTNQGWGNKASKETDAYNREIDYLNWRKNNVKSANEYEAAKTKLVEVEQNKTLNAG